WGASAPPPAFPPVRSAGPRRGAVWSCSRRAAAGKARAEAAGVSWRARLYNPATVIIIECPQCHARYQYDEERLERKPAKKIKCAKCTTISEIKNPAFTDIITPPLSPDRFERTFTRREGSKTKQQEDTTEQSPLPEKHTDKAPAELQLPEGKRISL